MKFLSIIFLLGALVWSWQGYKNSSDVPVAVHYNLQNELKNFIIEYVGKNLPSAQQIEFHRFWTEPTQGQDVRAVFEYSFLTKEADGQEAETRLTGYAWLSPDPQKKAEWSLDRIEINNQVIDFKTGAVVPPTNEPATEN